MQPEWQPYLHERCAAEYTAFDGLKRLNSRSRATVPSEAAARCTNAHVILRYLRTPIYVRENLFDSAKLANCGLDIHTPHTEETVAYMRQWGQRTRAASRCCALTPIRLFCSIASPMPRIPI